MQSQTLGGGVHRSGGRDVIQCCHLTTARPANLIRAPSTAPSTTFTTLMTTTDFRWTVSEMTNDARLIRTFARSARSLHGGRQAVGQRIRSLVCARKTIAAAPPAGVNTTSVRARPLFHSQQNSTNKTSSRSATSNTVLLVVDKLDLFVQLMGSRLPFTETPCQHCELSPWAPCVVPIPRNASLTWPLTRQSNQLRCQDVSSTVTTSGGGRNWWTAGTVFDVRTEEVDRVGSESSPVHAQKHGASTQTDTQTHTHSQKTGHDSPQRSVRRTTYSTTASTFNAAGEWEEWRGGVRWGAAGGRITSAAVVDCTRTLTTHTRPYRCGLRSVSRPPDNVTPAGRDGDSAKAGLGVYVRKWLDNIHTHRWQVAVVPPRYKAATVRWDRGYQPSNVVRQLPSPAQIFETRFDDEEIPMFIPIPYW